RYAERPQCLLPESIFFDSALCRPKSGVRKHQMASEILIQCSISRRDPEIAQFCLRLRPRQIERPTSAVGIVIKISELYRALFVFGDESRERDVGGSTGWDPYSHPEREDWVQPCSSGSSQLRTFIERHRISYRPAATNEFCAIRFACDI